MNYRIARGGEVFGPYSEDELRAYLASGNIVESDLARTDEMTVWLPVKKVLPKPKKTKQPRKKPLRAEGLRSDVPAPPDMPWVATMVLAIFTGSFFLIAWDLWAAWWLRRVDKGSRAIWYYGFAALLFLVDVPKIFHLELASWTHATLLNIAGFTIWFLARYSMRASLRQHFNVAEPIGLRLSWWMTTLFGGIYFQYQFNKINALRRAAANPPIAPNAAR